MTAYILLLLQIPADKVDFWKLHKQGMDLENMTQREMYPPRFKLVISGRSAIEATIADITFTGSQEDLDTEILLELDADIGKYDKCSIAMMVRFEVVFSGGCSDCLVLSHVVRVSAMLFFCMHWLVVSFVACIAVSSTQLLVEYRAVTFAYSI